MKRGYLVCLAAALCLLFAGAPAGAQTVNLGLDWVILGQHTPYMVALEKGYWKQAGLDVNVTRGWGAADAVKRLVAGGSDVAFADSGALVIARAKGGTAKIVAVLYGKGPHAIYSRKKTGILQPKDLEGKTIGAPPGDGIRAVFPAFARHVGIDTAKVKWIDVDPAAKTPMVMADKIHSATNFVFDGVIWRKVTAAEGGVNEMFFANYGFKVYGNGLMARDEWIAGKGDLVRKVTHGTVQAYQFTLDNPEEAARIYTKYHTTVDLASVRGVMPIMKEIVLTPEAKAKCIGWIDDATMAGTAKVMLEAYNVKEPVRVEDTYTRAFLPCK